MFHHHVRRTAREDITLLQGCNCSFRPLRCSCSRRGCPVPSSPWRLAPPSPKAGTVRCAPGAVAWRARGGSMHVSCGSNGHGVEWTFRHIYPPVQGGSRAGVLRACSWCPGLRLRWRSRWRTCRGSVGSCAPSPVSRRLMPHVGRSRPGNSIRYVNKKVLIN